MILQIFVAATFGLLIAALLFKDRLLTHELLERRAVELDARLRMQDRTRSTEIHDLAA